MANICATCRHWVTPAPSINTGGFGTCHLPSARKDAKLPPVIKPRPDRGWLATEASFGCLFHERRS